MHKRLRRQRMAVTVLSFMLLCSCMHSKESDADMACAGKGTASDWNPGNYLLLYTGADPRVVRRAAREIAKRPEIQGLQIRYQWKDLEPARGQYDFSRLQRDLQTLAAVDKRLVVQLQFKSFKGGRAHYLPDYIVDPELGGAFRTDTGVDVAYWKPAVQRRLEALVDALSRQVGHHASLEAINLEETALSVKDRAFKEKYYKVYLDGLTRFAVTVKRHFPDVVVIQYVNWPDNHLLESAVEKLVANGIGVGGPDVFTANRKLEEGGYRLIRSVADQVPVGMAVQYENYHATTHHGPYNPPGIEALDNYAREYLQADYIFWLRRPAERRDAGFKRNSDYYNDLLSYLSSDAYKFESGRFPSGGCDADDNKGAGRIPGEAPEHRNINSERKFWPYSRDQGESRSLHSV